jgi:uncharacterized protein (TIGR00251 family)
LPYATINIRVIPRAGKSGVAGTRGDAVLIRLRSAPVDGAANAELIEVVADAIGVAKRSVSIVLGEHARQKRIRVDGVTDEYVQSRLKTGNHTN